MQMKGLMSMFGRARQLQICRSSPVNMVLIAASLFLQGCALSTSKASDHFDGHHFHNRDGAPEPTVREEAKVEWEMRTKKKNWPDRFETKPTEGSREAVLHGVRVLWFGHAGVLIQTPSR